MADQKNTLIMVLGMHRSGTSALTRVFNLLGADTCGEMIAEDRNNPTGYWEHGATNRLNESILRSAGSAWDDWSELGRDWFEVDALEGAQAGVAAVVERDFGGVPLSVFKEPRLCRLAPLWLAAFDAAGIDVRVVLAVRHPREVAASLAKRDGMSRTKAYLLWLRHVADAERVSRGRPRVVASFDEVLCDWRATARTVGEALGIEWPNAIADTEQAVSEFIDPEHRHHRSTQLLPDETLPLERVAHQLFAELGQWERSPNPALGDMPASTAHAFEAGRRLLSDDEPGWSTLTAAEQGRRLLHLAGATRWKGADRPGGPAVDNELFSFVNKLAGTARSRARALRLQAAAAGRHHDARYRNAKAELGRALRERDELAAQVAAQRAENERLVQRVEQSSCETLRLQAASQAASRSMAAADLSRLAALDFVGTLQSGVAVRRVADEVAPAKRLKLLARQATGILTTTPPEEARLRTEEREVLAAELFDFSFYARRYPDAATTTGDTLRHWLTEGWRAGHDPNPLFATAYYLERNRDVADAGLNPLVHYVRHGESEGRLPHPLFDPNWYLEEYPDLARAGVSPLAHFLHHGGAEGRHSQRHPDRRAEVIALLEATAVPDAAGPCPVAQDLPALPALAPAAAVAPRPARFSSDAVPYQSFDNGELAAKLVAFYLPQFHPVAENDAWWGAGFTEWRNVVRATPQFDGHHQPRRPADLGYYDLRLAQVQEQQAALASNYGVHAFCCHFYWVNGRRILERPLDQFAANDNIELPFCLCWANENWTRTWDGMERNVLLEQHYSESDDIALADEFSQYLRNPRYLRANGKPVLVVYRPSLLPDAAATARRWREQFIDNGVGEVLLVCVQFDAEDPRPFGFDAALEFPPHKVGWWQPKINELVDGRANDFSGSVHRYDDMVAAATSVEVPGYPMIRGVCPGWDNTARRMDKGTVFHAATPQKYGRWLEDAGRYALAHPVESEPFVFVNAWNEWAEGAYLEPDLDYGFAYLQQTRESLVSLSRPVEHPGPPRRSIVLVTHDMHDHGAQQNALHMVRALSGRLGVEVTVIALEAGPLREQFMAEADVEMWPSSEAERHVLLERLRSAGAEAAICNTTVSGPLVLPLKAVGFRVLSLVHEMPTLIGEYKLESSARSIATHADVVVFPSALVRDGFRHCIGTEFAAMVETRPQGLYKPALAPELRDGAREQIRAALGISADAPLVLAAGYADLRKGPDAFLRVARDVCAARADACFVWLGVEGKSLKTWMTSDVRHLGLEDRVFLLPRRQDINRYFAAADVFLLPSREDPFPAVVIEAMAAGLPAVVFEGATGVTSLVESSGAGAVVPYLDEQAMGQAVLALLGDAEQLAAMATSATEHVAARFDWLDYMRFLLAHAEVTAPTVSVVVPNYNYARYLPERMESVARQTFPPTEIIVLDDASSDDSLAVLERLRHELALDFEIVANEQNSGSVFAQWLKGAELATGDLVWIAEADDRCAAGLLARLAACFGEADVVMAYCESRQMNEVGNIVAGDYRDYVADISETRWNGDWKADGRVALAEALSVKNVVPNVSAVLFRRAALVDCLRTHFDWISSFSIAGDYAAYAQLLQSGGKLAFVAEALNDHRRHDQGVTITGFGERVVDEIERMQDRVAELVEPTADAMRAARNYRASVRAQFGLGHVEAVEAAPAAPLPLRSVG